MQPVELIQQASSKLLNLFKQQFNRTSDFVYLHELLYCQHRLKAIEEQLQDEELINEVIDGFMTENFLQFGTSEKWEGNYLYISNKEIGRKKVATHVDLFNPEKQIAIEIKNPVFIYPKSQIPTEREIYTDGEADFFNIPENYLLQAKAQAHLLKEKFPQLEYYLVVKTTTKVFNGERVKFKKVWIVKEITPLNNEEWNKLVEDFKARFKEPKPVWHWECRYCPLKKSEKCQGIQPELTNQEVEEIKKLYTQYLKLKKELDNIEKTLRWKLKGKSIQIDQREIGYVEKEATVWKWEEIRKLLTAEELLEFMQPNWRKYGLLEQRLKGKGVPIETVKESVKKITFKL